MSLLLNFMSLLSSCSLFYPTVNIRVPKGYIGWCYIVPSTDTTNLINAESGFYNIDTNGVVYVPASVLNLKKDNVVKVYENDSEISSQARYIGSVEHTLQGNKYKYICFYLPSIEERRIGENEKYWRGKSFEYGRNGDLKFDSLLKEKKITFK